MKESIHKLPQHFLHKLKKIYPNRHVQIANTFLHKKTPAFRINYLKTDLVNLRRALIHQRVKSKELSYPAGSFRLKSPLRVLQNAPVYQEGRVFVQNISSMVPVINLKPQNGDKILDLCAAPGAKTTQIASLAPQAEVVAVEKIRTRYYKLMANLKLQGADKVEDLLLDGIWVRKKFPEHFDKVLADVPCSAEGRFLVSNPKTFKYWGERKINEMAHKQRKLLQAAFYALKEEGVLVYSTCTFAPEENEAVVDWFLNKFREKVEIMPLDITLGNAAEGLTRWQDKRFSPSLRFTRRIIPTDTWEGFFVAKFKKVAF